MKTYLKNLHRDLPRTIALAVLVSFGTADAAPFPVGNWDLVVSGKQRGVAQITFSQDMTLEGFEIVTFAPLQGTSVGDNPRGPNTDGRVPAFGGSTNSFTNSFGLFGIQGTWSYDASQRVIGIGNLIGERGTNIFTNGLSFRATGNANRLVLKATREGRTITYIGVPLVTLADMSGNYFGIGKRAGQSFTELFNLTPGLAPNHYFVGGVGPAYSLEGNVLISSQKKFAYQSLSSQTSNGVLRSMSGPFQPNNGSGRLTGVGETEDSVNNVGLRITKQP